jgi:hypothetical protein
MITPLGSRQNGAFDVDFSKSPRQDDAWWKLWNIFRAPEAMVDGWAIGQAVLAALGTHRAAMPRGQRLVWNEYCFYLNPADFDLLRPAVPHMVQELGDILRERITEMNGHTVGRVEVRLVPETHQQVPSGRGQLTCALRADHEDVQRLDGERTIRFDAQGRGSVHDYRDGVEQTLPTSPVVLRGSGQQLHLPHRTTVTLGRAPEPNPSDHLTVPGATPRVSRRHLELHIDGTEVRLTGLEHALTTVNGRPLPAGETLTLTVTSPVVLVLANEVRLELALAA